ncbi:gonadotropin subunit beta-2-like [Scomber japonicus]|uniref:gonadotropin subunit beta-2-like n=1 Tax=Scomber japonicus TaxID=13676 RepID=UPI0023050F53|nr:gonadotropin subunit beta-2-like [Scomber japonicus]
MEKKVGQAPADRHTQAPASLCQSPRPGPGQAPRPRPASTPRPPAAQSIQTFLCSCVNQDPVIKIPYSKVYQHVCTYRDFYYKTFELPDCPSGVDPMVTYPVALSCHCSRCAMDTSDCNFESLQPDFCMNDIPFYY